MAQQQLARLTNDDISSPPSTLRLYEVGWIKIKSTGDQYVGKIKQYRFCGNILTIEMEMMVKIRLGSDQRWHRENGLQSFIDYKMVFESCSTIHSLTTPEKKTLNSSLGDVIVLSFAEDDCIKVSELIR